MRAFEYSSATSVDEALQLLRQDGNGSIRPLAGGTDLLTLMKADLIAPAQLVDIKRAAGLSAEVQEASDGLRIGALTTLATLETHPNLRPRYTALADAAAVAATSTRSPASDR